MGCSASKMNGGSLNNLEEMVAVNDFLHDFECRCLVDICETEGSN